MEEHFLIKKAQAGDIVSFEELIKRYENIIFGICVKILKHETDAYDAAQETCIKIWKQMPKFEGNSKFSTWIYRIAVNQCLDTLRKNKRSKEISFHQSGNEKEDWFMEIEDIKENIGKYIEQIETQSVLTQGLNELNKGQKEIIMLRDVQNYSYEEISQILNISLGTVKSRLSRARNSFRKILLQDKEPFKSFMRQSHIKEVKNNEL
ncbi:RNA polymerase [Candidatus Epulonipiscium fishelsonii]|uniref:RNA polymerase n=1 Tax=Candidatus Epulonipiscium fishelsonii TaxID=77094 RepID=A0ACC8XFT3_9FIRM|nr:RNA polymerase [Epulopiscium sp. SCG-B05WGA-EpuloA1]ONI42481.1 RNA polymerase [Epulopiscium sp. SCG-B11WGA-EpuloA1]